jgi:hypothetical protein
VRRSKMKWIREVLRHMVHERNYFSMSQMATGRRFFWVAGHLIRIGVPTMGTMQKVNEIFSNVVDRMRQEGYMLTDKHSTEVPVLDISFVAQRAQRYGLVNPKRQVPTAVFGADRSGKRMAEHYSEKISDIASLFPEGTFKFVPPIHEIGLRCLTRVGLGLPDPREKTDFPKTPNACYGGLKDE